MRAVPCAIVALHVLTATARAQTTAFINGNWFDGFAFVHRTMWSVDGTLTTAKQWEKVDTVDLHNGYAVPAFGDAHSHMPASVSSFESTEPLFLKSGTFYILNPNDIAEFSNPIRPMLTATDTTIDVLFAHAGFTCTGGHPTKLYQRLVDQKYVALTKAQLEEQQQKEQRSAQTAEEQTAMREKHQQETQEMEARHQQQLQALPPKPATPATAPRHPMTPTVKPNVEKKAQEKPAKEKPDKPPRS